jgi:hypothetical protein
VKKKKWVLLLVFLCCFIPAQTDEEVMHKSFGVLFTSPYYNGRQGLRLNEKGSLVISADFYITRTDWTEELTVVFRDNQFIVAGQSIKGLSLIDVVESVAHNNVIRCEVNFLIGVGVSNNIGLTQIRLL